MTAYCVKRALKVGETCMKKMLTAIWVISVIVFFIDWGIVGLSLLKGNYEIQVGVYVGIVCWVIVIVGGPIYKLLNCRCPYCGKIILQEGKYCPHCGKEIEK